LLWQFHLSSLLQLDLQLAFSQELWIQTFKATDVPYICKIGVKLNNCLQITNEGYNCGLHLWFVINCLNSLHFCHPTQGSIFVGSHTCSSQTWVLACSQNNLAEEARESVCAGTWYSNSSMLA
jgi:hypothetical protein